MAEIVTGEAVVLDVPIAAFPSRMAAVLLDLVLQYTTLGILGIVIGGTASQLNPAAIAAIATVALVLVIVGYPTIFETLTRGKTIGKMALGLRVVSDDGGPERFRQALIRALAGIFEFTILAPVALITSLLSARGKRLGDIFAGTCVIQERVPRRGQLPAEFALVPAVLADWARTLKLSGLSDVNAEAAGSYLRRFAELQPAARDELGLRLATAVAGQVSPPPPAGTPPIAYLSAVLAVRRNRDQARVAATRWSAGVQAAQAAPDDPADMRTAVHPTDPMRPADAVQTGAAVQTGDAVHTSDAVPTSDAVHSSDVGPSTPLSHTESTGFVAPS